jgi:hypothetical protein
VILTKDSSESIADNTLIDPVSWENADERNSDAPAFSDLANNQIKVPNDDYSFGKVACQIDIASQVEFDFVDIQKNDGTPAGTARAEEVADAATLEIHSGWIPVSSGDTFDVRFRQVSGSPVDMLGVNTTWFEGWFL